MTVIIMTSRRRLVLTDDEDDHPAAIDLVHPDVPLVSEQCRGSLHTHILIAAPPRVRIPDVIIIDDDDDTPIPPVVVPPSPALSYIDDHHLIPIIPVVVPPSPALPLNIFQYAALFGHFPCVAASPAAVVTPHSEASSVFADTEALHGDSTSSGSSGSSGSELSGDFVVHEEPALRRKDRHVLEQFFPLTCKRLRIARVAPNLLASRSRKHRVSHGSSINDNFEVVD